MGTKNINLEQVATVKEFYKVVEFLFLLLRFVYSNTL